ncbi:RNA polymerase sigma factor [Zhouia amylolytica]|uniref:RNA polymerase sigma factor, sigma-70 family n=1 Tax=Zhouia amylolytica AD3 TaxID=1286632 RepID=W2UQF9_9FLAO|nr:sigma-70 family RNA polymerase sigma factor [Zhouia amylolytica]ETN96385.1 RNA polymerase sigma factor, sigma-70 family [Zhouia amylolytica AD3]
MLHRNFELLKNGDPAALEYIYAQYSRSMFWVGKQWLDDDFVIETLVQDVFIKLWNYQDRIKDPQHIYFFLKYVMKMECMAYHSRPKNKFLKRVNSLESYENYQDRMAGYDPENDEENLNHQQWQQKAFDQIKSVLPLLNTERRHLIELCLKYGFRYKAIGRVLGKGITETSNEVKRAIEDIKDIIHQGGISKIKTKPAIGVKVKKEMTKGQKKVLELRCKKKHSFAFIAQELNLSQKEVHKEFVAAYKLWQNKQFESV